MGRRRRRSTRGKFIIGSRKRRRGMGRKEEKEERGSRKNRLRERRTRGRRKKEGEEYEGRKAKVFFRVNCYEMRAHCSWQNFC